MVVVSVIDFRLGARMMRRHAGLSFIGSLALAVAIAVGSLAFQLLRNQVNPSLPLDDGDRVVRIENFDRATGALEPHSLYDVAVWRDELEAVEQIGAARSMDRNLIREPLRVDVYDARGRTLGRIEGDAGIEPQVVRGDTVWAVVTGDLEEEYVARYFVR